MNKLQNKILTQLSLGSHSIEELAHFIAEDKGEVEHAVRNLQQSGYVRQSTPGRYAIQEAADFPGESVTL